MPVLEEFNSTSAVTRDYDFVPENRTFILQATGLTSTNTLDVHIQNATGTEQLYLNGEKIQLTATHMATSITGPFRFKIVKPGTDALRVELYESKYK